MSPCTRCGANPQPRSCDRQGCEMRSGPAVLIRVQDRHGRGPYRPGMSARWSDPEGFDCPPWWIELGLSMEAAHEALPGGFHIGCGFRSRALLEAWFTDREQRALGRLGYQLVAIRADVVFHDTPRQTIFGSRTPLSQPLRACRLVSRAALSITRSGAATPRIGAAASRVDPTAPAGGSVPTEADDRHHREVCAA